MKTIGAAIVCAATIAGSIIGDMNLMGPGDSRAWDQIATWAIIGFIVVLIVSGDKS